MKKSPKWYRKALSIVLLTLLITAAAASEFPVLAATRDRTRPTRPTSLHAASVSTTSLRLAWNRSRDNVGVTSYAVFKDYAYLTYTKSTSCLITGLAPGRTYTFYVAAQDRAGNISYCSNKISVTTKPSQAAPTASQGTTTPAPAQKIVAGYYAGWAAYSGYTPSRIPADSLTHVIYAFAVIGTTNRIELGDPYIDPTNLADLKTLKAGHPNLRTLISVGGWSDSGRFSDMASTASGRATFASSVASFLKAYGLDGVDLDWEYPVGGGMAGNSARPEDKTNFTLLLQTLRQTLDAQGTADGKHYALTIAGGADTSYVSHVQMAAIAQYLDFATVMTYDMHGSYDVYTDMNAPLYAPSGSPQMAWSCDQAVNTWAAAGFPRSKLVMGIPFYGLIYSGATGGGTGLFRHYISERTISYDQVLAGYLGHSGFTRTYDPAGKTPSLYNGSTFICYEDSASIAQKDAYIKAAGLAGAGIWELSQNTDGTLVGAVMGGLK